jgi:hypothetical protein
MSRAFEVAPFIARSLSNVRFYSIIIGILLAFLVAISVCVTVLPCQLEELLLNEQQVALATTITVVMTHAMSLMGSPL